MKHSNKNAISRIKAEEKKQMMVLGAELCKFLDTISTFASPQKEELFVAYCLRQGSPVKSSHRMRKAA